MSVSEKSECDACGALYDVEDDAYECCRPVVYTVWVCDECGAVHRNVSAAHDCCDASAADADPYFISAAALEAAGQMRLLP